MRAAYFVYLAIPILVIYLYMFITAFKGLESAERERFDQAFPLQHWRLALLGLLLLGVFFSTSVLLSIGLALLIIISTLVGDEMQHSKLVRLEFDAHFERRLHNASHVSIVGLGLLLIGLIMGDMNSA